MKKFLLLLVPFLMLAAACDTTPKPKDYVFEDLAFTYPGNWKVDNEEKDGDRVTLYLVRDNDTFIYMDLQKWDEEQLEDVGDEDLVDFIASEAYELFELDKDDEEMDIQDLDILKEATDGDGFLVEYSGTNMGDPFVSRILCKMIDNYEVLVRTETSSREKQAEIIDIMDSFRKVE